MIKGTFILANHVKMTPDPDFDLHKYSTDQHLQLEFLMITFIKIVTIFLQNIQFPKLNGRDIYNLLYSNFAINFVGIERVLF